MSSSRARAGVTSDDAGLSSEEAAARLRRDGPNQLPEASARSALGMIFEVAREPMLLLLLTAAGIYVLLGDPAEAAVLGVSVLLVIALTVYQTWKSERALQALRDLGSPRARVLRDGSMRVLPARELVRDDLILLGEGERVPADARVLGAEDLACDESLLTGESVPVVKRAGGDDESGLLRASTLVVRGHAKARVRATGAQTEVGRIGVSLAEVRSAPSAMQTEMRRVVWLFALVGVTSCIALTVVYGLTRGVWLEALLAGITLAISNIPEEFPVVLSVFLALGAWRMAHRHALVRRPAAIEALGAISVLCTDKTGTLTENRMAVAELHPHAVDAHGCTPAEQDTGAAPSVGPQASAALLRWAGLACVADSTDPMELAILQRVANLPSDAAKAGLQHRRHYGLSDTLLAVIQVWQTADQEKLVAACKGAPEAVAGLCRLPAAQAGMIRDAAATMAARGLRVLGVAAAQGSATAFARGLPDDPQAYAWRWQGLLGLADPLRAGVPEAVARAQRAGIRVLMLTGDHPATAAAIAAEAGIEAGAVRTGGELETLDDGALTRLLAGPTLFARVRPEQKLRLVRALLARGDTVAMTGDGVNDAPALMAAHVGIAMGGRGTDVAREAAGIVLLDDNFVSIVEAIGHGRRIYDNIQRAVRYIVAVHVPITGLALLPLLLDAPLVLLPLHVVFLELIIDPSCSIVFERERADTDLMQRPPRARAARLLDLSTLGSGLARGLCMFAAVVTIYLLARDAGLAETEVAALAFTSVVFGNLILIGLHRSDRSLWQALRRRNDAFWVVVGLAGSLQLALVSLPMLGSWFGFSPPPPGWLLVACVAPLAAGLLIDLARRLRRRSDGRRIARGSVGGTT